MKIIRQSYDDTYFESLGDKIPLYHEIITRRMAGVVRSFRRGGRLLELGCGKGLLLKALSRDFSLYGIDISQDAIRRAKERVPEASLSVSDVLRDPLPEGSDVVLALNLLEHLPDPYRLMCKIDKALSPGGLFLFAVPNNYGFFGKLSLALMNRMDRTHISTFTRSRWIEMAESLDFDRLSIVNATWFGTFSADFAKHLAPILIVALHKTSPSALAPNA